MSLLSRLRVLALLALAVLVALGLTLTPANAATKVPKVGGLAAAGANNTTAKLGVRWTRVSGATYQVRWAPSTSKLASAVRYTAKTNSAQSPVLSNLCITWYAQVRAKKGTKYGAWSTAKALKFSTSGVLPPKPITNVQTSTTQDQVRWPKTPAAAHWRLDWSPAAFGNWPGLEHQYTPWVSGSSTVASVNLPSASAGDHFIAPGYGNPIYAQLQLMRCNGKIVHSPYVPVYPKAADPGSAATGNALRFGSYNVELTPDATEPARIKALANNIATSGVNVIALQEADADTASALIAELSSDDSQSDWATCGKGQQQVMWRTSLWTQVSCDDIGQPVDTGANGAQTPLPTPAAHLTPAVADPTRQDIYVASVHLEDRAKFNPNNAAPNKCNCTIADQKHDAHLAAASLIASIDSHDTTNIPVLVAGDFKGNFGGGGQPATAGNCDESSTPTCDGEGQPTFVRAGFYDARGAVTRVGAEYGSVNGHDGTQVAATSGVGGRADFILVRGIPGVSDYVIRVNQMYNYLPPLTPAQGGGDAGGTPSDHDLLYADVFVPFK